MPSRRRPTTLTPSSSWPAASPIPEHEIRILDDTGRELGERREGRLEFRGPSATSGYFQNPVKTRELFDDGWLDTGDRGYVADGDLFITGRIKDIIIRAGQHIAPHEIEQAVGAVPGIRKDGVAAFGVTDPASGTERVVVLAETTEPHPADPAALKQRAQEAATHIVGGPPDEVVLLPARHGAEDRQRQDPPRRGARSLSRQDARAPHGGQSGGRSRGWNSPGSACGWRGFAAAPANSFMPPGGGR